MTDLATRLLAAIEAKEAAARAATRGPWSLDPEENGLAGGWRIYGDELASHGPPPRKKEVAGWGYEGGGVWKEADARFIADNDPTAVLRRCAADRRIVARHELVDWGHGPACGYCRDAAGDEKPWPCLDIRDLAEGYGITEGGASCTTRGGRNGE